MMDKSGSGEAGPQDKQALQSEPIICPSRDELELYLRGKSSVAPEIERHLMEGCPSCSGYLELDERRKPPNKRVMHKFLKALELDAGGGYPSVYEALEDNQKSFDPIRRQTAARQRYALRIPVFQIDFRAEPRRLGLGWDTEAELIYQTYSFRYVFRITGFERKSGEETFEFQVDLKEVVAGGKVAKQRPDGWPDPKSFSADLLLEGNARLPLITKEETDGESVKCTWTSPRISAKQLRRRGGELLFLIEAFPNVVRESAAQHKYDKASEKTEYHI
jgi:hypothetical protein